MSQHLGPFHLITHTGVLKEDFVLPGLAQLLVAADTAGLGAASVPVAPGPTAISSVCDSL